MRYQLGKSVYICGDALYILGVSSSGINTSEAQEFCETHPVSQSVSHT